MSTEFFPKISLKEGFIVLNPEAIETLELDTPNARVIFIENSFPDKPKSPKEILIVKSNGSLCDDLENVKDVFNPELIRPVEVTKSDDMIVEGKIAISGNLIEDIKAAMGDQTEFKLLTCNAESPLAKEFREQWSLIGSYYRIAYINDKRACIGKDKAIRSLDDEKVSI